MIKHNIGCCLVFCMEYKRFDSLYDDEKSTIFHTHVPIQLYATLQPI